MGKIYSTTTQGIMWLGDYSEGSLMSLLEPITSRTSEIIPRACAIEAFNFLERLASDCHFEDNEIDPIITTRPGAPDAVSSLTMLMSLSWWRRIWTVQEVVLPQKIMFQCGYLQLSLETFDKAGQNFNKHFGNGCCPIDEENSWCLAELVIRMNTITTLREGPNDWDDLVFALNAFSNRFASDKRDKVYGLLGLFPTLFSSLSIDYSLPYAYVYTKTLIELIKLSGSLLPLLRSRETNPDLSLPSWVPNWDTKTEDVAPGIWDINFYNDWDAAGGRLATLGVTSYTTLSLLGCLVDSVVCSKDEEFTDPTTGLSSLIRCFPESLPLIYPSGGTYVDAFLRSTEISHGATFKRPCYFLTKKGLLGVSDNNLETGDEVYILFGGNVPFILRSAPNTRSLDRFYTYVGHSYVSGIMEGEVFEENTREQWVYLL
ncbi:hypothetical protein BGZ60DRAFT_410938 [Tricladium varicosporioides]|nr:hypothetical protein BGZ60DRAFT_410938 [Hymenoscyphus varicosporioides]